MRVTEYAARQTERMAEALAYFLTTMPEEKLRWQPMLEGSAGTRSVYQQVSECVLVNRYFAALLRGETSATPSNTLPDIAFAGVEDAQQQLRDSANELAEAILALGDERLTETIAHPRGLILAENFILMAYRNMAYHAGQLNFIQTLYGDAEFHVPPNWR